MKKQKKNLLMTILAATLTVSSVFAITLPLTSCSDSESKEQVENLLVKEDGYYFDNEDPNIQNLKIYTFTSTKTNTKTFRFANIPDELHSTFNCSGWTVFGKNVELDGDTTTVLNECLYIPKSISLDGKEIPIVNIGNFSYNRKIEIVHLNENITNVADNAFLSCKSLEEVCSSEANNLEYIGVMAFSDCYELENIDFSKNNLLKVIGDNAFENCYNLSCQIYIPSSITHIGDNAFSGCPITKIKLMENNIYALASQASVGDAYVVIEKKIANPENNYDYASPVVGCLACGQITISNTITDIAFEIFQNCRGVFGNLFISKSVATIDFAAFENTSITSIEVDLDNPVFCLASKASVGNAYIVIDKTSNNDFDYENSLVVGGLAVGNLTIADTTTNIGANIFMGCTGLTGTLVIPSKVVRIGNNAFNGCNLLIGLDLTKADALELIGNNAFNFCESLTGKIVFPKLLTSIGFSAFAFDKGITQLDFSNAKDLNTIGGAAFDDCSSLIGTITIPSNVRTIGQSAFQNCSNLAGLDLSQATSLTDIYGLAFDQCVKLTGNLIIPNSLAKMGNPDDSPVFDGCNFTSLTFKNDVPNDAFLVNLDAIIRNEKCVNIFVNDQTAKDAYFDSFIAAGLMAETAKLIIKS